MPRGKPGTGPHAGQGRQNQKVRDPLTGRTYNSHYYSYSKQQHMGNWLDKLRDLFSSPDQGDGGGRSHLFGGSGRPRRESRLFGKR
jgi:hypothetical protein